MLLLVQGATGGAAVRLVRALWSGPARVLLKGIAVRVLSLVAVLLSKRCLRFGAWLLVPLQGAAARCCCQRAVCALGFGAWLLQGAAARTRCAAVSVLFALWNLLQGAAERCCCQSAV